MDGTVAGLSTADAGTKGVVGIGAPSAPGAGGGALRTPISRAPLTECGTVSLSDEGPDACVGVIECKESRVRTACERIAGEEWYCDCVGGTGSGAVLRAEEPGTACALGTEVCAGTWSASAWAAECDAEQSVDTPAGCQASRRCYYEGEPQPNAKAVLVDEDQWTSCSATTAGSLCTCRALGRDRSFTIEGAADCGELFDLCEELPAAESELPASCKESYSGDFEGCELEVQCDVASQLAPGVTEHRVEDRWSTCQSAAGKQDCSCAGSARSVQFELLNSTTGLQSCQDAAHACEDDLSFDSAEDAECVEDTEDTVEGYCTSYLTCSRTATTSTGSVKLHRAFTVACEQRPERVTHCTCSAGGEVAELDLDGSVACSDAVAPCRDLVTVTF